MQSIIKKVTVPMSGVMLALAATGNLVTGYGRVYRNCCGALALLVLVLLIAKLLIDRKNVVQDMQNPVIASVTPTLFMSIMILSTYIQPFLPKPALGIWFFGILLHLSFIVYYFYKFILNFRIKNFFPSTYVVFAGIIVGSVTAPIFNLQPIGRIIFWFGLTSFILVSPVILYRVWAVKEIPEAAMPLFTIFAAPASLCLVGYLSAFQEINISIVNGLLGLSIILTLVVLLFLPKLLRLKFYPSYAAFGFPFVVSALALKKADKFLQSGHKDWIGLGYLAKFVEIFAVLIVAYVVFRYICYLFSYEIMKVQTPEKLSASKDKASESLG